MVKEKKIRKVFEEIYQEQLAKHRRGGTIQNLCRVIKTHCVLNGYSTLWIEIQRWYVFFYEKNGRRVRGVLGKDRTKDLLRSIL